MPASFQLSRNQCTFILFFIFSNIPQFFSQSNSSQNIQTFYPSSPLPPPSLAEPHSRRRSTNAAVGKAIAITAASTLVLSALLFILIQRYLRRKRERKFTMNEACAPTVHPQTDNFVKFNLKGIIVDENGLDVLYWKKLQEENRTSFKKQYYHNMKDDLKEEEKRMIHEKKQEPPSQEVHLLREKSSTSQSLVWGEKEQVVNKMVYEVENKQNSPVQINKIESMRSSSIGDDTQNKFDSDIMEALFGYVATNRKSPSSQILILDTLKSQNTAIVLKSLGISRNEIIEAVLKGRELNADIVEKLARIAPTDEEISKIITFDDDVTRLANAESFLYHLLKAVPTAFTRLNVMLFRSNYDMELPNLIESLQSIELACDELRARGFLLMKLLEAMLKAGNRLNEGNAQDFDLTALRKLSDVKSFDEKTTLLLFVVMEAVRTEGRRNKNQSKGSKMSRDKKPVSKDEAEREYLRLGLPSIGGLSAEFPNVKRAATMLNYDYILKTSSALAEQVVEMRKVVAQCGDAGGFARELRGFLDRAELEMREVKEEEIRVMDALKRTLDYYNAECLKDKKGNPLQLFVIVKDFLGMVDEACIEISRILSLPPVAGFQTIFRFPKLPADFMSETSNGSSSQLNNDSDQW